MKNNFYHNVKKRTERYWYQDGIWEMGFGAICFLLGVLYLVSSMFPRGGPYSMILVLLQMGVIFGSFWALNRFASFMKERITYPRTGYVAYHKPAQRPLLMRILLGLLILMSTLALVLLLTVFRVSPNRLPLVAAIVFAAVLIFIGYRFNLLRMYALSALTLILGFSMGLFQYNEDGTMGLFLSGFGIFMALSGGITLLIYLRSTRPAGNVDYEAPAQDKLNDSTEKSR